MTDRLDNVNMRACLRCTRLTVIAQPQKGKTMAKINKPRVATDTSLLVFGHNRGAGFSVKINYNSETREQVIKLVLKGEKELADEKETVEILKNP